MNFCCCCCTLFNPDLNREIKGLNVFSPISPSYICCWTWNWRFILVFFCLTTKKKVGAIFLLRHTETHRENLNANKFISLFLSLSLSLVYHIHSLNWIGLSWFHSFKNFFIFFGAVCIYSFATHTHTQCVIDSCSWLLQYHKVQCVCVCTHDPVTESPISSDETNLIREE